MIVSGWMKLPNCDARIFIHEQYREPQSEAELRKGVVGVLRLARDLQHHARRQLETFDGHPRVGK
jgi:hypothetical protein